MSDDFESNFKEGLQFFQKKQYEDAIRKFKDSVLLNSQSIEAHYYLGRSFIESENFDDAVKELEVATKLNPKDSEAQFYLGEAYRQNKQESLGVVAIKIAASLDPDNENYKRSLEVVFLSTDSVDEGISYFRELIHIYPKNVNNYLALSTLLELKGLDEEALIAENEMIVLEPYRSEHYVKVVALLKKLGRFEEARLLLAGAIQSFPDNEPIKKEYRAVVVDIFIKKIVNYTREKKWNEAISTFQSIIAEEERKYKFYSPITRYLWEALEEKNCFIDGLNLILRLIPLNKEIRSFSPNENFYRNVKINEDVIVDYINSIQENHDCVDLHSDLIYELEMISDTQNIDTRDLIIEECRRIISLDSTLGYPHCKIGYIFFMDGEYENAIYEFRKGIEKEPDDPKLGWYRWFLTIALVRMNQTNEAIPIFHKATEFLPSDYWEFYALILDDLINDGLLNKATEFCRTSIEIFNKMLKSGEITEDFSNSYSCAHYALGKVYEKTEQSDKAISQFHNAITINEGNVEAHRSLANILMKKNQVSDAISEYQKVIEYEPKNAYYHEELAEALMKNGQFLDAEPEYREAMKLDLDNKKFEKAWLNLKEILFQKAVHDSAIQSNFTQQNPLIETPQSVKDKFQQLISNGENNFVEFKTNTLWSNKYTELDIQKSIERDIKRYGRNTSKFIIAKTIAGFLNAAGGHLIIGIKENKNNTKDEIVGIEGEYLNLEDPCPDGYRRMIVDDIIKYFFSQEIFHNFSKYINISFQKIDNKSLCWLQLKKSDIPVFININREDYFFIRIDAETRQIAGQAAMDYCFKRFKEK